VVGVSGVIDSATTTTVTSSLFTSLPVASGRYIINFLSGALAGQTRLITSISGTTLSWATPFTAAPAVGVQFELLVSNAYQISLLGSLSDDSIINALVFGA
jgi:F420-0:gamma-glutamyl ligase-like protein